MIKGKVECSAITSTDIFHIAPINGMIYYIGAIYFIPVNLFVVVDNRWGSPSFSILFF